MFYKKKVISIVGRVDFSLTLYQNRSGSSQSEVWSAPAFLSPSYTSSFLAPFCLIQWIKPRNRCYWCRQKSQGSYTPPRHRACTHQLHSATQCQRDICGTLPRLRGRSDPPGKPCIPRTSGPSKFPLHRWYTWLNSPLRKCRHSTASTSPWWGPRCSSHRDTRRSVEMSAHL